MGKEQLSVGQMKRIAHDIIDAETKKHGIKVQVFPVTFVEYYNDYLFKKPLKLSDKVGFFLVPLVFEGGFRINSENDIVLFLHRSKEVKKIGRNLFRLIENSFHEARHVEQDNFAPYSYEGFLRDLEDYISSHGLNLDYVLAHDKYFVDIDAHLYSVAKAREYFKSNYPELFEEQKSEIEELERRYMFDCLTYDAVDSIESAIQIRKKRFKSYGSSINNPIFLEMYLAEEVPHVMNIFLNWNCTFKSVNQILSDAEEKKIDKRIIYAFLSSKHFLEGVDMECLSSEELQVVTEALEYTDTVYKEQAKLVEESHKRKSFSLSEYLKLQKRLVVRVSFIGGFLSLARKIYSKRKEKDKIERSKVIGRNLVKSKKLLSDKKNSGFVMYDIFYIIGLLFSVLTLIYIFTS